MLALPYAVKLLAGRDKSESKLRQALEKKAYAASEIDAAIARVKALGYLDEARFAQTKARELLRQKKTPSDIRHRLERDGLAAKIIDGVLEREAAGFDPLSTARALLAKKKATGVKAARFLTSRGFDDEVIRAVLPGVFDTDE